MVDEPPQPSRRRFLQKLGIGVAAPILAKAQTLTPEQPPTLTEEELYKVPLTSSQAIDLLEHKLDATIFNNPELLKALGERFSFSTGRFTDWGIKQAAHIQIRHTVAEFSNKNPWDTVQTLYERITPRSAIRRYKASLSRAFYNHYVPQYAAIMKEPEAQRNIALKKYANLEEALGQTIGEQLAYQPNSDWPNIPVYERPPIDFDRLMKECKIDPSPFTITEADLKNVGVDMDWVKRTGSKTSRHGQRKE